MSKSLSWDDLKYPLQPWIRNAIDSMGFENMTPVQASTIPMFAKNKDVVVESVTGSGKTIAFVIPILEKICQLEESNLKKGHFHSLIISPTRELASQIQVVIESFLVFYEGPKKINSQLLVGSSKSVREDYTDILENKPYIIVGTPGRLLDFLTNTSVKTNTCSMVVLDEADKLLDMSFEKDVEAILRVLPKQRRTGLFSATISSAGNHIFRTGMTNPVKIAVKSNTHQPSSLSINYMVVKPELKFQILTTIFNNYNFKKCIVYLPTCISVTYIYQVIQHLIKSGIISSDLDVFSLHGKLQTQNRMKTLEKFTESLNKSVLLCTDVAARGIDIPDVDLVIQLDPPTDPDVFLHRCGRTGRANRSGKAIVFLNEGREEDYIPFLEVKRVDLEPMETITPNVPDNFQSTINNWILEDRARHDLSVLSYVGFVRTYSKHSASSIFRLQTFDYVGLAKMYGLIRLPKMPELKYLAPEDTPERGWLIKEFDMDSFKYTDASKEKKRQQELKEAAKVKDKHKLKQEQKKRNMAWSNQTESQETKAERREKMAAKRKAIEESILNGDSEESEVEQDWKDMVRKNKKKKTNSEVQGSFDDL